MAESWYLREVTAARDLYADPAGYGGSLRIPKGSHGIVVKELPLDLLIVFWSEAEGARIVKPEDLIRFRHPVTSEFGDVWAAIIAELPDCPLREAALDRRSLGISRYGEPLRLRDQETAKRYFGDEAMDLLAYAVEWAATVEREQGNYGLVAHRSLTVVTTAAVAVQIAADINVREAAVRAAHKLAKG